MPFDEKLAGRIRRILKGRLDVEERQMFGGLAFMIRGHMCCGIVRSSLMVRLEPDIADALLGEPHVRPMDFTGKPMRGFLFVDAAGIAALPALRRWISRSVNFAEGKPAKPTKSRLDRKAGTGGKHRAEKRRSSLTRGSG